MYKRIYGRKKYQYRIRNCAEDVKVSEEEIDAEIAKENAKYSGHPSSGMLSPGGSDHGTSVSPQELLRNFVQFGSKEYKHEFKKARDRLYKRKLRVLRTQGIMDNSAALDIPRADIEVEMLSRYTANKTVQAEMEKRDTESANTETAETVPEPSSEGGVMYEVRVETETSVLLEDLELRLDNVVPGEGAAGGQEGAAQLLGGGAAGGQGAAAVLGQEGAAQLLGGGAAGGQGAAVRSSPAATCEVCGEHFEQKQQLYDHRKDLKMENLYPRDYDDLARRLNSNDDLLSDFFR